MNILNRIITIIQYNTKYTSGEATFDVTIPKHSDSDSSFGVGLSASTVGMTRDEWICELTKRAAISIVTTRLPAGVDPHQFILKMVNLKLKL